MPFLHVRTNLDIEFEAPFLKEASAMIAEALGKPERFVMVQISGNQSMLFAGTDDPLAFVELKSLGLETAQTEALSGKISALIGNHFSIAPDRIYTEFAAPERAMFGWNGGTF